MPMSKIIVGIIILIIVPLAIFFGIKNRSSENDGVHLHAGFQVYVDGELQDFKDLKYMNFVPCGEHDEEKTPEEEQMEKAHLHDFIDDVVHVHREGATWGDLFKNMKYDINPQQVYINGDLFEGDFMNHEINAYDSVLILQGEVSDIDQKLQNAVTKEHIIETEKKSEYCAS